MSKETTKHTARILAAVYKGEGEPAMGANITHSWTRCLDSYGLDPRQYHRTPVLDDKQLREQQERLETVLEIAKLEMNELYRQIDGSGFAIILTNSDGVIVNWISDPGLIDSFKRAGLWLGAIWSEENEGTNGIGTCLIEKRPLTVHRDEHFRTCHTGLTCSAAPIFDPDDRLLAVLDVSAVSSPDSRCSQLHTLALAILSARVIEHCYFLETFRAQWVLRFHQRPEFVGLLREGMLAFDGEGRILAANRSALSQLGWERCRLVGQPIDAVLTTDLDTLLGRASRRPSTIWAVRNREGRNFFAVLHGAEHPPLAANKPLPVPVESTEPSQLPLPMTLEGLMGEEPLMAYNVRCARRVMNKPVNILLTGETGIGKEAFAKAIHEASDRAGKPFVAVNCASIPEHLIESELFGYKYGAFTGARREGMRGKILQASGGTLFLDEIGDMPPLLQTRLLRVLEEKEILPLGSDTPIALDLKVISATHRDLQKRMATGEFREDLYYRLNALVLTLPALRERSDRALLIRSLLALESAGMGIRIHEAAFAALNAYPWPGNIRQLRNVLRTAVALCEDNLIRLEDLPPEITRLPPPLLEQGAPGAGRVVQNATSALACAEKEALLRELDRHRWNITNTSAHLGMSRNTLYRKMRKHGLKPPME